MLTVLLPVKNQDGVHEQGSTKVKRPDSGPGGRLLVDEGGGAARQEADATREDGSAPGELKHISSHYSLNVQKKCIIEGG